MQHRDTWSPSERVGLSEVEVEIRLVNEDGFHKTILEKTAFESQSELVALVKAFEEGRRFAVGVKSGGVSATKAFEQGILVGKDVYGQGFLLGYRNPVGKIEVVK